MCYIYIYHFLNKLNYIILMVNEFIFILILSFLYNVVYKNKFYFVFLLDFFYHLVYHHPLVKGMKGSLKRLYVCTDTHMVMMFRAMDFLEKMRKTYKFHNCFKIYNHKVRLLHLVLSPPQKRAFPQLLTWL